MSDTFRSTALRRRCAALILLLGCWSWSASAHAWTKTRVERAQAHLTVDAAGRAQVALQIGVRVQGGWLSRFEMTGLDADFALDPEHPPLLTGEDGNVYVPQVKAGPDAAVVLTFPTRRAAPHRGLHQLALMYTTQLKTNGAHVSWALPPWGVDLENASVTVDAPAGSTLAAADDEDVALDRGRAELGARALLTFRRAQLPRTVALAVQFDLPADAAGAATTLAANAVSASRARSSATACAGLLVLALCALKRRAVRALCAQRSRQPLPLIALSPAARASAMLALTAAFGLCYETHASLGLLSLVGVVALALDRGFVRQGAVRPALDRSAPDLSAIAQQRAREWFGALAWFDATAPLGLGLLGSAYTLAALRLAWNARPGLWLEVLLVVTPLWLTATRIHCASRSVSLGLLGLLGLQGQRSKPSVGEVPKRAQPR